ncbi:MAG TPA: SprT-like domain-containing protein [Planctomycetota bacterium]|nr:SprT-like domain-containing protein [Planctomycetota bacterium]
MVSRVASGIEEAGPGFVRSELERLAVVFDDPRVLAIDVRFSRRMSRSLARAYLERDEVRVSVEVLSSRHLPEIMTHEVAHLVCYWRHGRTRPHGREWKDLMRMAGERPRACLDPVDIPKPVVRRRRRRAQPSFTMRQARAFFRSLL